MTATLPILSSSIPAPVVAAGKHTRNKRAVAVRTCETCPAEVKAACVAVCPDMDRFLLSNGNTISHNSPLWGQMVNGTVSELTESKESEVHTASILSTDTARLGRISDTGTPESLLLEGEAAAKAETLILQHVAAFCDKCVKKSDREKSIVESIVVLHYLEGYDVTRVAEILGERFNEFAGYYERQLTKRCDRVSTSTAVRMQRQPKGRFKVSRTLAKFQEFIRGTHLADAIHKVMATGSVEPVKPFAAKA